MLQLLNVQKKFDKKHIAVNDLTININKGEIYGLLGPNGSGKTTTFRLVLNLLFSDKGKVLWNGKKLDNHFLKKTGYVPEVVSLMKRYHVLEQLIYLGGLKGLTKKQVLAQWEKYADILEIRQYKKYRIKKLSKGNVQKIQILAAILHDPELIILDEPFSGLDVITTNTIKKLILILKERGKVILFSSHRLDDIEEFCHNITILKYGHVVKQGSIHDIRAEKGFNTIVYEGTDMDVEKIKKIPKIKYEVLSKEMGIVSCEDTYNFNLLKETIALNYKSLTKMEVRMPTLSQIFIDLLANHEHEALLTKENLQKAEKVENV